MFQLPICEFLKMGHGPVVERYSSNSMSPSRSIRLHSDDLLAGPKEQEGLTSYGH
jgi:hypothetical protein